LPHIAHPVAIIRVTVWAVAEPPTVAHTIIEFALIEAAVAIHNGALAVPHIGTKLAVVLLGRAVRLSRVVQSHALPVPLAGSPTAIEALATKLDKLPSAMRQSINKLAHVTIP
jgi:hypothetical protein